jgi:hypothetical protein
MSSQQDTYNLKSKVIGFYQSLFQKDPATMEQCFTLLGNVFDLEIALFDKDCQQTKSLKECDSIFTPCMELPYDCRSMIFQFLQSKEGSLTYGRTLEQVISLVNESKLILQSSVLEVRFSDSEKVYFRTGGDDEYGSVIGGIYLSDRSSIFNTIPEMSQYYLELEPK